MQRPSVHPDGDGQTLAQPTMQLIDLPRSPPARDRGLRDAQAALAGVIGAVGDARFGSTALAALDRWLPLAWWSAYTLYDDAPPVLHAHGAVGEAPDGTGAAWQAYHASLYRRDASFAPARGGVAAGSTVLLHRNACELPEDHRQAIYSAHGLRERLSIVSAIEGRGLLAVNFYRHERQAVLSADAMDAIGRIVQPLLACVRRHIALRHNDGAAPWLAALPRREREVCERLLRGWTHEGVAADLDLAAATVKTYRDRAFRRLGIRYRHELFALAAGTPERSSR